MPHARDKATGYSATVLLPSRDIDLAAAAFVKIRIDVHGPPRIVSGDSEFSTPSFRAMLDKHDVAM